MRTSILSALFAASILTFAPAAVLADDLDGYARAVDEKPDDPAAYESYATAAIGAKRYDDAIAKLKVGVARLPGFNRGFYLLAYAYRSKSAWSDSAAFYRVSIAVKQNENEAYFGLGRALAGMGDNKGAVTAYKAYVEREKDPAKQKFVDNAKAEIDKLGGSGGGGVATAAPAAPAVDVAALKAEADALQKGGRYEDAVTVYKKAIAADASSPELHNDLGNALFALKRYSDAGDAFKAAVTRDEKFAIGWYNVANAMRKAERRAEAVEAYKRYMALQPNDPDPHFGLAQTLKSMGDTAGAVGAFKKYLEMERRPEQQKWVEKARAELSALEPSAPAPAAGGTNKSGLD